MRASRWSLHIVIGWLFLAPSTGCSNGSVPEPAIKEPAVSIALTSDDFKAGQPIPTICTGEGKDRSPHLAWGKLPPKVDQLALICDDPDAPTSTPWVHWVIYGLAPDVTSLPPGLPPDKTLTKPLAALQGKNSWPSGQTIGYRGPMPPPGHGVHHYHFKLYALDTRLELQPGLSKDDLLKAMKDHVMATGELIGTYERKKP
jgi:Raf kinase inhibitor-like YbhB/YbcL family protein